MPKTICLDFDGVLSDYHGWRRPEFLDPPRPGLRDFLETLSQLGYEIVVHTTRDRFQMSAWLTVNGLHDYVHDVVREKPPAIVYLDDRAVCFKGDYDQALREIQGFKAYWETP